MGRILAAFALLLLATSGVVGGQPSGGWTLVYSVSGGIAGLSRTVTVTDAGRIRIEDRRIGRLEVGMDRDLFVRARDAATAAHEVTPTRRAPYPDEIVSSLKLTAGGRTRDIEMAPDLVNALGRAADIGVWQALVGTWHQAALTYCSPKAHLSPDEVEPAIESLVFNGDSSFTVHWPGDPHPPGQPRVAVPSARGSFRAALTTGGIQLTPEDGATLRDFAGSGTFRFDGERRLLLRNVWLGTRSAKTKPDVCELAFERD